MKKLILAASFLVLSGIPVHAIEVRNDTGKTLNIQHKYHVNNGDFNKTTVAANQKQAISSTNTFLEISAWENGKMVVHCPDENASKVNTVTFKSENDKVICTIK